MSAIWGFIDFNGNSNKESIVHINNTMRQGYADCKIDRYDEYIADNICIGCGIQYFTPEAKKEVLPIIDEERGIFFTADAIIDNREELLTRLGYQADDKSIPDAGIIYEMYDKYGDACLNDMLGVYTFVYYNKNEGVCHIINDAVGYRTLQYRFEQGKLFFSTLLKPLCDACGKHEVNYQWFADFLSLDSLAMAMDYSSTPYLGVNRLRAATHYTFSIGGMKNERYWNPNVSELKLGSDDEYKKRFIDTYQKAVDGLVRNDDVTILLSGGLDSTSIVCMLARSEKHKNIRLKSYTMTNSNRFSNDENIMHKTDESDIVLETKKYLHDKGFDFECNFVNYDSINTWDERVLQEKIFEMPYKSTLNILWMREALSDSYKDGARIMLMGSYGNSTVSLDINDMYFFDLIRKKKYVSYFVEYSKIASLCGVSKRRALKNCLRKIKSANIHEDKKVKADITKSYISGNAVNKYNVLTRLEEKYKIWNEASENFDCLKKQMFNELHFYHYSEFETRNSLYTGCVYRDPTLDKRVIELCMSLPLKVYGKNGIPRRLIREYLKDFIPDHCQNYFFKGVQSADLGSRFFSDGNRILDEVADIFEKFGDKDFIDSDKILADIDRGRKTGEDTNAFEIFRLEYTAMALEMMEHMQK